MGSIALMMIHNCMSYLGYANSNEMRKAAEDNDKINQSSIEAYKLVSNLSEDEIKTMMNDETWLTAEECLKYGFATEVADLEEDDPEVQQSAFSIIREAVLKRNTNPLEQKIDQLLAILQKEDEADPDDEDEDPDDPEEDPDDEDEDSDDGKQENCMSNIFKMLFKEVN